MKLCFIIGRWSSGLHGGLDPKEIYKSRALTGSESSFFNVARTLAERGHDVTIMCDTPHEPARFEEVGGALVLHCEREPPPGCDAYVSLNEAKHLKRAHGGMRVCWQQLGDFPDNEDLGFDDHVDAYVALSPRHLEYVSTSSRTRAVTDEVRARWGKKWHWIPNSTNLDFFDKDVPRDEHAMVWCSSPDRGLHRLIEIFPRIRQQVSDASLKIFYRFDPWYEVAKNTTGPLGDRARYIHECLGRVGREGENGIKLVGPVGNVHMATELLSAGVLPYTCDCLRFTESFSVSVLDACAAACVPVISDEDAIGQIYGDAAVIIKGKPGASRDAWVENVCRAMEDRAWSSAMRGRARTFAGRFGRERVAYLWERFLSGDRSEMPAQVSSFVAWDENAKKGLKASVPVVETVVDASALEMPVGGSSAEEEHAPVTVSNPWRPLRIAVVMGKLGSAVHGIVDVEDVFESKDAFVTGTVAGFFNIAWGLGDLGHTVDAFCDAKKKVISAPKLGGANFYRNDEAKPDDTYDAYISINEPDSLRVAPAGKLRIVATWLNDFSFCRPGFDEHVDVYACPSETHMRYLAITTGVDAGRLTVIPLSINPEFHEGAAERVKGSIAYCSSPDRGLHHLLAMFPEIKLKVPEATLKIYYRFTPWYNSIVSDSGHNGSLMRQRADKIRGALDELGENGENGVHLIGQIPQREMARQLRRTMVFAYTCDPVRFTEGFSLAAMDACAAGCVPIISGVDALPEIYWGSAHVISGNPGERRQEWVDSITRALTDPEFASEVRLGSRMLAKQHTRHVVARKWEALIMERKKR